MRLPRAQAAGNVPHSEQYRSCHSNARGVPWIAKERQQLYYKQRRAVKIT